MPEVLNIAALPTLGELGFMGGRDSFHAFCRRLFAAEHPRYARTDQGLLVVFRHADLTAFGTSAKVGTAPPGVMFPGRLDAPEGTPPRPGKRIAEVLASQVFTNNPPLHGATRRILLHWVGPRQTSDMEGIARETAAEILRGLHTGEAIDFVPHVAEAFTVGFWGRLLHLNGDESRDLTQAARDMTRLFVFNRQVEDLLALDVTFDRYAAILDAAAIRGLERGDPALVAIERQRQALDHAEDIHSVGLWPKTLGEFLAGNLIDGVHTAALATANACLVLARHADAAQAVREDPSLLPKAISESLRIEPPVIMLKRYLLEDFEHDGDVFIAGQQVMMMWGAGNLDPSVYPRPEIFDLSRRQQGLTTFGLGAHICPGRHVAVMLTRVLLEQIWHHGLWLVPAADRPLWHEEHTMSQLRSLPMMLVPV